MKKIFTLGLFVLAAMSTSAQEYNLFDPADCDADGWLWLNTQEKIDKYVGLIDEDNYTVNPNGKIIQMAFANITPDYPETKADPDASGVGTVTDENGNYNYLTEGSIAGSIILAKASAMMSTNGGCLVLNLPSCSTISLYLTSEARMLMRTLMLSPNKAIDNDDSAEGNWTGSTKAIYSKASVLGALHSAGHYKWEGIESLNNGYNEGVTFKSEEPVYFALQNCHAWPVYIHAIKVTTPKPETAGVSDITVSNDERTIYNLAGQKVSAAEKGLYIVNGKKVIK